ncbi:MAG: NADH-quinone oxidoreductase subunit L, partial [Planctomycetia bacterium]|nr:NADH-quinone oxidoreductase subunit L [Planctomycetia bacterium]
MEIATLLPLLLGIAWLVPLASFVAILFLGNRMGPHGKFAANVATAAIGSSLALSVVALGLWLGYHPPVALSHGDHGEDHAVRSDSLLHLTSYTEKSAVQGGVGGHGAQEPHDTEHHGSKGHGDGHGEEEGLALAGPVAYSGDWYTLYAGGSLRLSIGWYIDSITVLMFVVVTLIATCIHVYAAGYMHDELHPVTDAEVQLASGGPLTRAGRFHRFFQALSLFCFSMLGIVIAGNLAMVFVFWELVGICSWFLIGFYFERHSASTAANKAFIVNRVGDFGMLIGLMALWGGLGTLHFGSSADPTTGDAQPGLFELVRPAAHDHQQEVPDGLVEFAAANEVAGLASGQSDQKAVRREVAAAVPGWREAGYGRWLLFIAGIGIFCGCVGKSAQVPLFVWLPDAMEGPTPVSALVHSATMVAAGVYLVGRFYPVLTPDVLLVIAYVGGITLFIAATIAVTANDIKRVLAYSTVSQLGYMMLALGVGGWVAGLFHLVTHAFFKSLLFLCSGSVIHACHTNDMRKMGGLLKVMPYTAWTMLIGCLAIIGAGIPFVIGLSGYYSKDAILAQALLFARLNPSHGILYLAVAGGAFITAFYMFRLWFMTFAGSPRDHHVAEHAHESPKVMTVPLVVLAVFAVISGWGLPSGFGVAGLLEQSRPAGTAVAVSTDAILGAISLPAEHDSHAGDIHVIATLTAFLTATAGVLLAALMYLKPLVSPAGLARLAGPAYTFLVNRWYVDELYHSVFVVPTLQLARLVSGIDKIFIDGLINGLAWAARQVAGIDAWFDRTVVDGLVNAAGRITWNTGIEMR